MSAATPAPLAPTSAADGFTARETITMVTPLGMRFRDVATLAIVADGLQVRHVPDDGRRVRTALATGSGVWVLPGLPGPRELENGSGDAAYWATAAGFAHTFAIEVTDA